MIPVENICGYDEGTFFSIKEKRAIIDCSRRR